jgi:protein-S-isoprenylcysteine O-methyltransferase Ste14
VIEHGIFILLSLLLLIFTLTRSQRHRFPRFFAFESLFILVLLNARSWFLKPLSLLQLISWLFLASSLVMALHGFWLLRIAYRYIRHPLYCSLLLGGMGAFLKAPSALGFLLFICIFVLSLATAKVEEEDNIKKFGDEYLAYMKRTKMLLPFLI